MNGELLLKARGTLTFKGEKGEVLEFGETFLDAIDINIEHESVSAITGEYMGEVIKDASVNFRGTARTLKFSPGGVEHLQKQEKDLLTTIEDLHRYLEI